jgi:hypothetical protein
MRPILFLDIYILLKNLYNEESFSPFQILSASSHLMSKIPTMTTRTQNPPNAGSSCHWLALQLAKGSGITSSMVKAVSGIVEAALKRREDLCK